MARSLYSRRGLLGAGAALAFGLVTPVRAELSATLDVYKDPNCGCCTGWIAHLRQQGFLARVTDMADLAAIKQRLGVPDALTSCHTARLNNYVIEGHVPAHAIRRLLAEKPQALGLAVPGMPIGSPGMEGPNPQAYDVRLLHEDGTVSVYAQHNANQHSR